MEVGCDISAIPPTAGDMQGIGVGLEETAATQFAFQLPSLPAGKSSNL
jgi:hypothetical protein